MSSMDTVAGVEPERIYPASFVQRSMWAAAQRYRQAPLNVMPAGWRIRGRLQPTWVEGALTDIIRRHATLRTRLVLSKGQVEQHVFGPYEPGIAVGRVEGDDGASRLTSALEQLRLDGRRPIDVGGSSPLRAHLLQIGEDDHVLGLFVHHAMFDGMSAELLVSDLAEALEERAAGRPWRRAAPATCFGDYARRQVEAADNGSYEGELKYWRQELDGLPPSPELPTVVSRKGHRDFLARAPVHLESPSVMKAIVLGAKACKVSSFSFVLAAVATMILARTGSEDFVIGVPTLNRWSADDMQVIGCYTSMLPARLRPRAGISFAAFAAETHGTIRRLLAFGRVPLELILRATQDSPLGGPVFPVWAQLRPASRQRLVLNAGLTIDPVIIERGTLLSELDVDMIESESGLACEFAHRPSLYGASHVADAMAAFSTALRTAMARPDDDVARIADSARGAS